MDTAKQTCKTEIQKIPSSPSDWWRHDHPETGLWQRQNPLSEVAKQGRIVPRKTPEKPCKYGLYINSKFFFVQSIPRKYMGDTFYKTNRNYLNSCGRKPFNIQNTWATPIIAIIQLTAWSMWDIHRCPTLCSDSETSHPWSKQTKISTKTANSSVTSRDMSL